MWRAASRTPRFTPCPGSRPRNSACRPHSRRGYAVFFDMQQRIRRSTRLSSENRTYPALIRQTVHWKGSARQPVSRVLSRPAVSTGDGDGHSSGTPVTERLVRPTRAAARRPARRTGSLRIACRSYLVLLPVGFSLPPPLPAARCALAAPFHPCRPSGMPGRGWRCTFCGTFPGVAPAGGYPAPYLRGARTFLSPLGRRAAIRPSGA